MILKNVLQKFKIKRERERVKSKLGFTPLEPLSFNGTEKLKGKNRRQSNSLTGFTLIELLIVIAIIGLLSSVVLASLNSARKKARDARRISDLNEIRTALELYFDDKGYYPPALIGSGTCNAGNGGWDCNGWRTSDSASWNDLATELALYIRLPKDPINNNGGPWITGNYSYAYGNVGRNGGVIQYDLTTQLEDTGNPLRCGVKLYTWYFTNQAWCTAANDNSPYSRQIYEASLR